MTQSASLTLLLILTEEATKYRKQVAVLEQSQELCPGIWQNTEYWDRAVGGGIYFWTQAWAGVCFRVHRDLTREKRWMETCMELLAQTENTH